MKAWHYLDIFRYILRKPDARAFGAIRALPYYTGQDEQDE
jgi:hypothetical protein